MTDGRDVLPILPQIRGPAEELKAIAMRLTELSNNSDLDHYVRVTASNPPAKDARLLEVAKSAYQFRRRRANWLPDALFGEPAWDMLLDLFIAHSSSRDISVTSLCIAANVPPTTALRHIQVLEAVGMIARSRCLTDNRRAWVSLTEAGIGGVRRCLEDWKVK